MTIVLMNGHTRVSPLEAPAGHPGYNDTVTEASQFLLQSLPLPYHMLPGKSFDFVTRPAHQKVCCLNQRCLALAANRVAVSDSFACLLLLNEFLQ